MPPKTSAPVATPHAAPRQHHDGAGHGTLRSTTYFSSSMVKEITTKEEPGTSPGDAGDGEGLNAVPVPTPVWTDLKTKAGKERKRLPLACKSCRRKKVRCSGETPSCKHCLRARIPCVYKVTQRKATPRTDYMTMLDRRLKRMEERVIKLIPPAESTKIPVIGRASVKPPSADKEKSTAKKRAAMEAFAAEPEENVKMPPNSNDASETSSLMEGINHLPSTELQEHLAEVYFDCVYGQPYHLLHKPSFMRRLRAGTIPPVLVLAVCAIAARFSTHPQLANEPPSLRGDQWAQESRKIASRNFGEPNMTIIIVIALLALYDFGSCQGGRAWMYCGIAMRMCYALQLNQEHGQASIAGSEQSSAEKESKGRVKRASSELSFTDQEIRRRTMWSCFLMDVFNSSGTKRPNFDHLRNIKIQLPIEESMFQMEIPGRTEDIHGAPGTVPISEDQAGSRNIKENMGVAAYLVKVLALWYQIVTYTNSGRMHEDPFPPWHPDSEFIQLEKKTHAFWDELPLPLRYSVESFHKHTSHGLGHQFALMHIIYQQVLLFLHKFAIPAFPGAKLPESMPNAFRDGARRFSVDAATKISTILDDTKEQSATAPFASYCSFASGTVHIWGLFSRIPELVESSKKHLQLNMRYLLKMKKYWSMVHYMTESLKDIYRHHADSEKASGINQNTSPGDDSFFEYGNIMDRKHPPALEDENGCKHSKSPQSKSRSFNKLTSKQDLESVGDWFQKTSQSPQLMAAEIPNRAAKRGKQTHGAQPVSDNQPGQLDSNPGHHAVATAPDGAANSVASFPQSQAPHTISSHYSQPQFVQVSNPYQDLDLAASFNAHPSNTHNTFFSRLPLQAYDRQLVYGAYAQDPTLQFSTSAFEPTSFNTPAGGDVSSINVGSGAVDANIAAQLSAHAVTAAGGMAGSNVIGYGDASAAWLTPFHVVPPVNLVQPEYAGVAGGQGDSMAFGMDSDTGNGNMEFWNT